MTNTTTVVTPFEQEFITLSEKLVTVQSTIKELLKEMKDLQKKVTKLNKTKTVRRKQNSGNIRSGFAKPTDISPELCKFLGKPNGTQVARTEVTKYLTNYIKDHELQDKNNRRKIVPDKQLARLLKVTKTDEITYFNLQKYMKPHFASKST